jgi:lysozyme
MDTSGFAKGVDLAGNSDGAVDFRQLLADGWSWVYAKATTEYLGVEPLFEEYWQQCGEVGITRSLGYHFYNDTKQSADQIQVFLDTIHTDADSLKTALPAVLDIERTFGGSKTDRIAGCHKWLDAVEAKTGKVPLIYSMPGFWNDPDNGMDDSFGRHPVVIAHYGVSDPGLLNGWSTWDAWQYAQADASHKYDENVYRGTHAELVARFGL